MATTSVRDEVLGELTWDEHNSWWTFEVGSFAGRSIPGSIIPEDNRVPFARVQLATVRECVIWIRANEPAIREFITRESFNWWLDAWYDEEIDEVNTPEGFRETIRLGGVNFYEDGKARVCYEDGGLLGGHSLWVTVGPDGTFEHGPELFG
jgi:hypothetical protein